MHILDLDASICEAPMDSTPWEGPLAHVGPIDTVTPLVERLSHKTTCGTLTLMAGVLYWGATRFSTTVNQGLNSELVRASFAYQVDWRYYDHGRAPFAKPPSEPMALSATVQLHNFLREAMTSERQWYSFFPPVMKLSTLTHLVRHVLHDAHKTMFDQWLDGAIARIDRVAFLPDVEHRDFTEFESVEAYHAFCAPQRGRPLPAMILDLDRNVPEDAETLADLARTEVRRLDPTKNRFLRSATEMRDLGFDAVPYD